MKTYAKLGYKLTNDDFFLDEAFGAGEQLSRQLEEFINDVRGRKDKPVISKLKQLIKEYPNVPKLKSYLATVYRYKGELDKARKLYEQLVCEYPTYLYGRTGLASFLLEDKAYDKIEELLGTDMDIRTLFPEREVFHLHEVSDFLELSIRYFTDMGQIEKAEARYKELKTINSSCPELGILFAYIACARLGKHLSVKKDKVEKLRKVYPQKIAEKSENVSAPVFQHEEINNLYRYDDKIPQDVLQEILELPRASVISDLEKVLDDTVDRYGYFSQADLQVEGNCFFALHAFFLLAELRAEESLPKILSILAYDDDFTEFWFGDYMTEDMWIYFYRTGFSRIDEMKEFLFNPGVGSYVKCGITGAIVQTALHNPEKKEEMIEIYAGIIDYYLNLSPEDAENNIEPDFINILVNGAIEGRFKSLLPQIKELYDKEYAIDSIFAEKYKDVFNQMNKGVGDKRKARDIHTVYQNATGASDKADKLADKSLYDSLDRDEYKDDYDDAPLQPATSVKTGRNDPCPCGSGKKYKKCCLGKEEKEEESF
ncbi:MAG: DUF1186 domain-containing protein [Tannerellaceae bacterium]|jgi:tetratricopeptide (TPR) repeat protein|nr:DUF1186 domain-containing protein [Tannerellaceae bacterium]